MPAVMTAPKRTRAIATTKAKKSTPAIVVHLGNVGQGKELAEKTKKYSRRFGKVRFIGIDLAKFTRPGKPRNWRQWNVDFLEGLERLRDNSVSIISSEMGVGYFDPPKGGSLLKYAKEVVGAAYKKLKPGGKLMVVLDDYIEPRVKEAITKAGFESEKTTIRPLKPTEYNRTFWTRLIKGKPTLYQIIAIK